MVSIQLATVVLTVSGIGQTVLYDFTADWCGPCKMMEPAIQQLHSIGYPVQKVNIDQQPGLAKQYGITSVPCVVLVVNGREVNRHLGVASYQELVQMLSQASVRPTVAVARGQNDGSRRGRLRWPRDRANSASGQNEVSGTNIPRVSLGQEVPSPHNNQLAQATGPPPARQPAVIPAAESASPRIAPNLGPPPNIAPPRNLSPPAQAPLVAVAPPQTAPPAALPANGQQQLPPLSQLTNPPTVETAKLAKTLVAATVRLRVMNGDAQSLGSGSIIDIRPSTQGLGGEALILTCGHIFRETAGKGAIQVDLFDGSGQEGIAGRLIRYDLARDIGLISVAIDHALQNVHLASKQPAARGQSVMSVGCDHGQPPTLQQGLVMAVNSFVGPPNIQVAGQPAVGRSGGGLFNDQGQLIGVCNFADPTDRAGLYAGVEVAHDILEEAGIQLAQDQTRRPSRIVPASKPKSTSLMDIGSPSANLTKLSRPSQNLASEATEVICIVRSKNGTGTERQVIVIENAPVELLDRLASEQQKQQGTYPTTLDVAPSQGRRPIEFAPR